MILRFSAKNLILIVQAYDIANLRVRGSLHAISKYSKSHIMDCSHAVAGTQYAYYTVYYVRRVFVNYYLVEKVLSRRQTFAILCVRPTICDHRRMYDLTYRPQVVGTVSPAAAAAVSAKRFFSLRMTKREQFVFYLTADPGKREGFNNSKNGRSSDA